MHHAHLPLEVFQGHPTRRRPEGKPRSCLRGCISCLACEYPGGTTVWIVKGTSGPLLPPQPGPEMQREVDGRVRLKFHLCVENYTPLFGIIVFTLHPGYTEVKGPTLDCSRWQSSVQWRESRWKVSSTGSSEEVTCAWRTLSLLRVWCETHMFRSPPASVCMHAGVMLGE